MRSKIKYYFFLMERESERKFQIIYGTRPQAFVEELNLDGWECCFMLIDWKMRIGVRCVQFLTGYISLYFPEYLHFWEAHMARNNCQIRKIN